MSRPTVTDSFGSAQSEMVEAALRLFTHGVRSLVSLSSVGWAATADPSAGVRVFGTEEALIRAVVDRHGQGVKTAVDTHVAEMRASGAPFDSDVLVALFTGPIRQVGSAPDGPGWFKMLMSLAPGERQHAHEFVQGVVDALTPVAALRYPSASPEQLSAALRTAVQMIIGAVAQYSRGMSARDWLTIESFAAGGLDAVLRRADTG